MNSNYFLTLNNLYEKIYFYFYFYFIHSSRVFADYILEPANCTLKKKQIVELIFITTKQEQHIFVNLEKCKEIMPALEEFATEEKRSKESKKSKIPKFKKKEKKSKIPKFKKKSE